MEITALGYVLLPLGLFLLLFNRDLLYYIFIFFTPFSASSVLNVPSIQFGMQPAFLLGALCLISLAVDFVRRPLRIAKIFKIQQVFIVTIWLFWLIALVSLAASIILYIGFDFEYKTFNPGVLEDLGIRKFKLTAFTYLTFFLFLPILTLIKVDSRKKLLNSLRFFFYSGLFTIIWGLLTQIVGFFIGMEYPSWLFNNHIGYIQFAGVPLYGVPRMNSVAAEPSHQAFFLLIYIAIFVTLWVNKVYIVPRRFFEFSLLLALTGIILTTSTTGIVTLAFGLIVMTIHLIINKLAINLRFFRLIILVSVVIVIIIILSLLIIFNSDIPSENFIRFISENTIGKLQSGSGQIRTSAIPLTLEVFLQNPIIGTGWGRNRSFDLATTLLANIGIIGFASYILVMMTIFRIVLRVHQRSHDHTLSTIGLSFFYALILALFACFIAIPDFLFLYFWVLLGLAASLLTIYKREQSLNRTLQTSESKV